MTTENQTNDVSMSMDAWYNKKFAHGVTNSGLKFKVKRADMPTLMASGRIPIPLLMQIQALGTVVLTN